MKLKLEQNAMDVIQNQTAQKGVITATLGTTFASLYNLMPDIISIVAGIVGIVVGITMAMKNLAEYNKLKRQEELLDKADKLDKPDDKKEEV